MDLQNQLKSGASQAQDPGSMTASSSTKQKTLPKDSSSEPSEKKSLKINFRAIFNWLIFFLIVLTLVYLGYRVFKAYTYQPQSTIAEIKIIDDQETIRRIEGSIEQGTKVSTSEAGYGRTNPFDNY
jgi:hypothetical protein